jgi:hypothetical protein
LDRLSLVGFALSSFNGIMGVVFNKPVAARLPLRASGGVTELNLEPLAAQGETSDAVSSRCVPLHTKKFLLAWHRWPKVRGDGL